MGGAGGGRIEAGGAVPNTLSPDAEAEARRRSGLLRDVIEAELSTRTFAKPQVRRPDPEGNGRLSGEWWSGVEVSEASSVAAATLLSLGVRVLFFAMTEPDDFGLSPIETLAHVGDPTRSPRHARVWKAWSAAVAAARGRLEPSKDLDPSDPTADVRFTGVRHARIGGRLLAAKGRARAGIVVLHGYSTVGRLAKQGARWEGLRGRGAAVLLVRVRGYPGSRLDVNDWGAPGAGWITRGLEVPSSEAGMGCEWSFAYGVADAVVAARALRTLLAERARAGGGEPPIFLAGESFGAALAVVAASHLSERDEIARLAIGLPSMGDWAWRLAHTRARGGGRGAGAEITRFLADHSGRTEEIVQSLRVFDAAIHARDVRCPVLCKLAIRDDVVPAPAAAAVFNALAGDPGRKSRFVTRYGHFDGGVADVRRHATFDRLVEEFLDPGREPEEALARAASG